MDEHVVLLAGEFDIANARQISDRVARVLVDGAATRIVLDLKAVTFLDCAGIRNILYAKRLAGAAGREFVVRRPTPIVAEIIGILGLGGKLYEHRADPSSRVRQDS